MKQNHSKDARSIGNWLDRLATPKGLAVVQLAFLAVFLVTGDYSILPLALLLPAAFVIANIFSRGRDHWYPQSRLNRGVHSRSAIEKELTASLLEQVETGRTTASLAVEIDEINDLRKSLGGETLNELQNAVLDRLVYTLRDNDSVGLVEEGRFIVALAPERRLNTEGVIHLCNRIQSAMAEPFSVNSNRIFLSVCIGFCLPGRIIDKNGESLVAAALTALEFARESGPSSVRAYTPRHKSRSNARIEIQADLKSALETNEIGAWFQPQIDIGTNTVMGFEAVTRWDHPEKGLFQPEDFLPALREQGHSSRLREIMLSQAILAMKSWDGAGFAGLTVAVSLSEFDLMDPQLPDSLKWDLDRYEVKPETICIQVDEALAATNEHEVVMRNVDALSEMGCNIVFDNFGTGSASMEHIRRFKASQIKIDRSFIMRVDRDAEQKAMLEAILSVAEKLKLKTIACGVDTAAELSVLAKLGCQYAQGLTIARPMRAEDTLRWIKEHEDRNPVIALSTGRQRV